MAGLIPTYPALLAYEVAFNAAPNQTALPPYWTSVGARTHFGWDVNRGRQYELDINPAGQWNIPLDNRDGALDPSNASSPFSPNVVPYRGCRIRAVLGANALSIDQATAGEGTGYLGAIPVGMNVSNDLGYPLSIVASGSAYQGAQVYQAVLPSAAGATATVLLVTAVPVVPSTVYSFGAQVRIPSGTSTATACAILWYDANGNALSSSVGTSATLASGSSAWTALTASGTAPAGALNATLKVQIASGSTAAQTTWQADGLQFEQSATPTPFQVPQSLSANLLPRVIATGSASLSASDSAFNWWFVSAPNSSNTLGQIANLAAAPTGATTAMVWQSPVGTTSATILYAGNWLGLGTAGPQPDIVQVAAGSAYTASWHASRASSADATVQVTPQITWYNASTGVISTTVGSAVTVPVAPTWGTRVAVSGTAPAGAVWARIGESVTTPATTTAINKVYHASWQFEQAASASPWVDPGPAFQIFSGLVERWPQTWTMNGTYGQVGAIGVDASAALAQFTLAPPFVAEVLALAPNFFYQLNDPSGSSSCADSSGRRIAAPVENAPAGVGGLTFGNAVTSTTPGQAFTGSPGPVATFNNNPGEGSTASLNETFISIHKTTVTPGPPAAGGWTRIIHFRSATTPTGTNAYSLWEALPSSVAVSLNGAFDVGINGPGGTAFALIAGNNGAAVTYNGGTNICDGNWHAFAVTCDGSGNIAIYIDGASVQTGSITLPLSGITSDTIGASVQLGAGYYRGGVVGDVALAAELPLAATAAQIANFYSSFRSASSGESSGARAKRLLTWIGWTGPTAIDAGQTSSMGPATDLTGATALDALNAVALTENGNAYVSTSGAVTLKSRTSRYNATSPLYVFGENAQYGEWPYESVGFDYDPTHLFDNIQVTQYSTGQVATAQSAASQAAYFPRILQRTINVSAFTEAVDASNYLIQQYAGAHLRVADLLLHPAAVPGLFAVCLQLEIGTRVRIMRRPPAGPGARPIQMDGFVESIRWSLSSATGDLTCHVQCSPADLARYWLLGALRTTLNTQATSGTNTATINALPDSAVNALNSSLPQGYQLVFEPGTARAETMTLAPTGIPATTPGYSTATLTFTGNFAFTHAAGTVVCEPLPAGVTDPTAYDAASVLGAASCTILSGGASGTNTVTVGPLGDAKSNAPSSDWTTGDLLWISPGAAAFEGYNLLHPNLATAGEGALPLAAGATGAAYGLTGFYATPLVAASASAWQGANVWAAAIAGAAATGHTLVNVLKAPVAAGLAHTWSIYTRSVTTSQNPQVNAQLVWLDANGNTLSTVTGSTSTLTGSPTASWTRLTVSATAPAGAAWAAVGVNLSAAPASAWSFQCDGLQFEQNAAASTYCTTPQVLSVAPAVAGYTSVAITLNTNLINTHAAGDTVCDPLPPGTAAPPAGTCRLSY